jgi:hypothetical protein
MSNRQLIPEEASNINFLFLKKHHICVYIALKIHQETAPGVCMSLFSYACLLIKRPLVKCLQPRHDQCSFLW